MQITASALAAGAVLAFVSSASATQNLAGSTTPAPAPVFGRLLDGPEMTEVAYDAGTYLRLASTHAAGGLVELEQVPLPGGEEVTLALRPIRVMPQGARAVVVGEDGSESFLQPGVVLFSGSVPGRSSHAYLAAGPGAVNGYVRLDGELFVLSSGGMAAGTAAIARASAIGGLGPASDWCNVATSVAPSAAEERDELPTGDVYGIGATPVVRHCDVFVECDHQFKNQFASSADALDYALTLFGAVSDIYRRDLGVVLEIPDNYIRVWNGIPPWGPIDDFNDLGAVRTWWQSAANPLRNISRAAVHVLTHPVFGGVAANVGGVCSHSTGYEISSVNGSFPLPIHHRSNGNWDPIVVAHECGHTWGSPHTFDYNPPIECVDGSGPDLGTIMSYCHLEPGGVANVGLRFHATVQNVIRSNVAAHGCFTLQAYEVGDYDLDGVLTNADLAVLDQCLVQGFYSSGCEDAFDLDGNSVVDAADRAILNETINGRVTVYCAPGAVNVTGVTAEINLVGNARVSDNAFTLTAAIVQPFNTGLFITSPDQGNLPLGNGTLCLGTGTLGFIVRFPGIASDFIGIASHTVDLGNPPLPGLVQFDPGSTWNFQYWYRDPIPGSSGFNFSSALEVLFAP